jgi:hypothetical protein
MKIIVSVRDQYGRRAYHPECEKSSGFAKIAGTKTLTVSVLKEVIRLGYNVINIETDKPLNGFLREPLNQEA